jgi:DNA polymerase-3 subunit epsilon
MNTIDLNNATALTPVEKILFFDTETTGIPLNGVDIEDPRQPRIVQIAAELVDAAGTVIKTLNSIIKPDGFDSIPEGAQKAHGISIERCHAEGRDMKEVLEEFNGMMTDATQRAAYNISFDKRLTLREYRYHKMEYNTDHLRAHSYCVMKMVTPIIKMAPTEKMIEAGFGKKNKPPKLIEAYEFAFGRKFDNAHDALADVRATRELFFWLRDTHPEHFKPEEVKEYVPEMKYKPSLPADAVA